jgi:mannose-6-phosphate isomerase-like protein (cupin superfamily)
MGTVTTDSYDVSDIVVSPADGEVITARENREAVILAERSDITFTWYRLGPGEEGPEPHVHHQHTDSFYVLDGELSFLLGPDRERVTVGAGGLVCAPPNVVHTFATSGDAGARFLNIHSPDGGFAGYMRGLRDRDPDASFDSFDPPADGGLPLSKAVVSGPGEGERLVSGPRVALVKAALPQMFLAEFELNGHFGGPDPHEHDDQVDSFYVLEGDVDFTVGDATLTAGPDTLASVPRNVRHTFARPREGTARLLNIHAPDAGFAAFIRRVSD